jgi:hypothetical protein
MDKEKGQNKMQLLHGTVAALVLESNNKPVAGKQTLNSLQTKQRVIRWSLEFALNV